MSPSPKQAGIRTYTWVKDPSAYKALLQKAPAATIPVVLPAHGDKSGWDSILQWYGLSELKEENVAAKESIPPPRRQEQHWVISTAKKYDDIARFFHAATGRRFMSVRRLKAVRDISFARAASVLFIGEEPFFSLQAIQLLSQHVACPWGIAGGRNFSDASFFIAKLLAAGNARPGGSLFINAMDRTIEVANTPRPTRVNYNRAVLNGVIGRQAWDTVSIFAHGEASHLKLNNSVICGKIPGESVAAAAGTSFCTGHGDERACIRVHNRNINIFYLSDFRAKAIHIYSCISFNSSAVLAPSNVSFLSGIARSFPASGVLCTRNLVYDEDLVKIMHGLTARGVSPSFAAAMLNDVEAFRNGDRPFVLVGDPAIAQQPPVTELQPGKRMRAVRNTCYFFRLGRQLRRRVIGIDAGIQPFFTRGQEHLVVCFHEHAADFEVTGMQEAFDATERFVESFSKNFSLFEAMRDNISGIMDDTPQVGPGYRELFAAMCAQLGSIRQTFDVMVNLLADTRHTGLWNDALPNAQKVLASYLDKWQEGFCRLLKHDYIFAYIRRALTSNTTKKPADAGAPCDYCGATLKRHRFTQPTEAFVLTELLCDWCGDREISTPDTGAIRVTHAKKLKPGGLLTVKIKNSGLEKQGPGVTTGWHLVISLFNKSLEKEVYHEYCATADSMVIAGIRLPAVLTGDLHVLRVVSMYNGGLKYYRCRVSVLADKNE